MAERAAVQEVDDTFARVDTRLDVEREVATRRGLVPSEREVGSGSVPGYRFTPPPAARAKPRRGARELLRQMDPRDIAASGPILPLILLTYLSVVANLDSQAFAILLPEIRNDFGVGSFFLTALISAVTMAGAVFSPVMGYIADRTRRVTMLAVGTVVSHAAIAASGVAPSLGYMGLARGLVGVGELVRQPAGFPLLTDYYPPRARARVFVFLGVGSTLGMILGPVVGGLVGSNLGWRPTILLFGTVCAVLSLSLFFLKEPVRGREDRLTAGASEAAAEVEQRPVSWTEGWRAAWSVRTLRVVSFSLPFTTAATLTAAPLIILFYSSRFHVSPLGRGLFASAAAVPALAGLALASGLTERLLAYRPGRMLSLTAGVLVVDMITLVGLVASPNIFVALVFNMIASFVNALVVPLLFAAVSLVVPPRIRGLGIQVTGPFVAMGLPVPIILAGLAASQGPGTALLYAAPLFLIAAVIVLSGAGGFEQDIRAALAASLADETARKARLEGRNKLLVCRGIDVVYDGAQVLFDVDLDIEEGEIVALLGTNGAGKSTLLRCMSGVQHVSNGAVFLDGDDVTHVPPHAIAGRGVVMMPGGRAVFPTLTVKENLDAAAWMYRGEAGYIREKTAAVLEMFPRLKERMGAQAGNLSGGEQQMLALSQALIMRPRLLLIDELSLGLAPQVVEQLLDALRQINAAGTTIVIVEQSVNVALQVARRAVYMEKGEIRFDGSLTELMRQPDVVRSVFLSGASTAGSLGSRPGHLDDVADDVETVLQVEDVALAYGGVDVLRGVSLTVRRGEVVGMVGPNGAGKSSLFDVVTGFATPSAGSVTLMGRDVTRLAPHARARLGLARSYQNVRLFPALTVRETIAVALERHLKSKDAVSAALWTPMSRGSERRVTRRVDKLIDSLNLGAYANKFLSELSTGTRRIVDIACLLAAQPRLLLLDEPSSGLAQAETEMLAPVISRIVKEAGCGVLIIEHDLGLVAAVSDRLLALRLGQVMAEGTPAQVLADPEVVSALMGGASEAVVSRSIQMVPQGA